MAILEGGGVTHCRGQDGQGGEEALAGCVLGELLQGRVCCAPCLLLDIGVIKSGHVAPTLFPKNYTKDCQGQSRSKICLKFVMIQFPFLGTLCICIFYVSEGGLGIR